MFAPEPPEGKGFHAAVQEFPHEYDVYLLNQSGTATAKINTNRLEPSQYWESKQRTIGIIIIVCVGFLVITLLGETHFIEEGWKMVLSFLGQFMPKLPKLW